MEYRYEKAWMEGSSPRQTARPLSLIANSAHADKLLWLILQDLHVEHGVSWLSSPADPSL